MAKYTKEELEIIKQYGTEGDKRYLKTAQGFKMVGRGETVSLLSLAKLRKTCEEISLERRKKLKEEKIIPTSSEGFVKLN